MCRMQERDAPNAAARYINAGRDALNADGTMCRMRALRSAQVRAAPWLGLARMRHGTARHGTARHGTARHGTARHGTARHGTARHGTARHGTARHGCGNTSHHLFPADAYGFVGVDIDAARLDRIVDVDE
ncbi:hypothetical protein [Mycetohabitans rhizoxinica]|uniref:Uncharacterized protein n=1 Tax=Mycetohabitans rhizoxinica TaxID=412963 RepID=A0ABZ2PYN2_9BURK